MNIVHISPNAPYNDCWGFQENLLPKYQSKLGHKVTLIITNLTHFNGKIEAVEPTTFVSEDGFDVIRLPYADYKIKKLNDIFLKLDVYGYLEKLNPDVIFYHGLVSQTIFDVIKYQKRQKNNGRECVIIQDNHLDYNIGRTPNSFKEKLLRFYYRLLNRKTQKCVERVYGVTPWRKQYAEEYYNISPLKTDVLIMGADDEKIDFINREHIRNKIRHKYNIVDEDFLIVTGGKIDAKKKIHFLMEACGNLSGVKLLVFGSIAEEMKSEFQKLADKYSNIIPIGWIAADKVYDYFFAADLVCFPGQHSVLWEQACAAKAPCLFASWPGMDHVNNGGNSAFIDEVTVDSIRIQISELIFSERYFTMKAIAESDVTDIYLYSEIARKSLNI
ncbi:MAG: glycosyltransferase family 4 protein [Clostridia bacterium]|nr:glycosyltransferase family 4 protein [Clostridia bacterium]